MTWARLDDGIYDHPKIIQAGRDARELFFASIVYCSRHLTDGVVPSGALRILQAWTEVDDARACAQRLLDVGLWEQEGDRYIIHDYLKYQPTKEEVEVKREARAEAGRKGGMRSGEVRAQKAHDKRETHGEANEANHEAFASENTKQNRSKIEAKSKQNAKQNRTPSHPIPSEEGFSNRKVISGIFTAHASESGADAPSQPTADTSEMPETTTPTKRHAPINPLWDALVDVFGYEPRSTGERSKWGKIVKHLKDAKATPEDVLRAKANYDAGVDSGVYRWSLTPNALDNHLGELLNGAPRAPTPSQPRQPVGAAAAAAMSRPIRTLDDVLPEGY